MEATQITAMNDVESTNGICDHCKLRIEACQCEDIHCQTCEDSMPRKHKCAEAPSVCPYCDEPIDDCHCQPSGHYD
jgi:hypothetical protein